MQGEMSFVWDSAVKFDECFTHALIPFAGKATQIQSWMLLGFVGISSITQSALQKVSRVTGKCQGCIQHRWCLRSNWIL